MFREIILPIFRSTRVCVTSCGLMHPRCCRPATGRQHRGCITPQAVTQSSAPEDGQNNCPKHVELIGSINKLLLMHLVGCLYYLYQWCMVKQISNIYGLFLRVKRQECKVNRSPSSIAEIKNEWRYASTPFTFLSSVERDNFKIYSFLRRNLTPA